MSRMPLSALDSWPVILEEIEEQLAYVYEHGLLCGDKAAHETQDRLLIDFVQLVADRLPRTQLGKCAKKVLESSVLRETAVKAHRACKRRIKNKPRQ